MATIPEPRISQLSKDWYGERVEHIAMLRLDEVHPIVSGNKWYKLKYNIAYAQQQGYKGLVTFGGAYSNHLIATAAAANEAGMLSIGIIRGEHEPASWSHTLRQCETYSMQLVFVSRQEYKNKTDAGWLQQLQEKYPEYYIVPEGGANEWGRVGAAEIANYIPPKYTHICISVGTSTTLAGIAAKLPEEKRLYGYAPMKGGGYIQEEVKSILPANNNIQIFDEWHFGGFGKWNNELVTFMNDFYESNYIPLDMVYTAKMMYGIKQQLNSGFFPKESSILCIHTGGLQGNESISQLLKY